MVHSAKIRFITALSDALVFLFLSGCATTYHSQGEEVDVGGGLFSHGLNFKVTGSYWTNDYNGTKPQQRFLVVKTSLTNATNQPLAFQVPYSLEFALISAEGAQYAPVAKVGHFAQNENVNPGMTATGEVVFDVPDGIYTLRTFVHNALIGVYPKESDVHEILLTPAK